MSPLNAPTFNAVARMAEIRARFEPVERNRSASLSGASAPAGSVADRSATGADFASLLDKMTSTGRAGNTNNYSAGSSGSDFGSQVLDIAQEYLGIPYVWGGTDPSVGLDCSGFVQNVYSRMGIDLPRVSRDQAKVGTPVESIDQAIPGDLIAFGEPVDHIAIYMGDGKIIHAPHTGDVVKVSDIYREPTAIRRVVADFTVTAPQLGAVSGVSPSVARFSALFRNAGIKYGISPQVLAAVAQVESGGNTEAVSSSGALGLMQFMPSTAASMGIDPLDPGQAIDGAARYLSRQQNALGSLELALASYNAGPGAVRRYGGVPPYAETRAYVSKVMSLVGTSA